MFSPEELDVAYKWWVSVCVVCKDLEMLFFARIPGNARLFNLLCEDFIK